MVVAAERQMLVESKPDTLGGRTVFAGTRVPVEVLFDNLADGLSINEIAEAYPTLDRSVILSALAAACALLKSQT